MFTSQLIAGGTVKPKETVKTFGVPMVTVKRYVKVYREHDSKGFYEARPGHSSAPVLKGPSKKNVRDAGEVTNKSARSQTDSQAPMGNGATLSPERVAAAMGELEWAPIEFQATWDVAQGGVLVALARIRSLEQLRYQAPGEWGKLLGLDRISDERVLWDRAPGSGPTDPALAATQPETVLATARGAVVAASGANGAEPTIGKSACLRREPSGEPDA